MTNKIITKLVTNEQELLEIESLNQKNSKKNLTQNEIDKEGYVSWQYSFELLKNIHQFAPSIITIANNQVIGYALTCTTACNVVHPELNKLFTTIKEIQYNSKKLFDYNFYLMGQICIDKKYRGQGVFKSLYDFHKQIYSSKYQFIFTTISTENQRSIKAHLKQGFKIIETIDDHFGKWVAVIWDWN